MSAFHHLKILPEYFSPVKSGLKRAELRKNDRDFKVGDIISLEEFESGEYTGDSLKARILHVADVSFLIVDYVLISFQLINESRLNFKIGQRCI